MEDRGARGLLSGPRRLCHNTRGLERAASRRTPHAGTRHFQHLLPKVHAGSVMRSLGGDVSNLNTTCILSATSSCHATTHTNSQQHCADWCWLSIVPNAGNYNEQLTIEKPVSITGVQPCDNPTEGDETQDRCMPIALPRQCHFPPFASD